MKYWNLFVKVFTPSLTGCQEEGTIKGSAWTGLRGRATFFLLLSFLFFPVSLSAQVRITVQAPTDVVEGDRFRVSYVVNTQEIESFKVEPFEGLVELYGPSQSRSSSFSMVNGKTTSSSTITYTYTVTTEKAGTFHIPVATVVSGGQTYKSNSPQINVLPGGGSGSSGSSGNSGGSSSGSAHQSQADRMHTQNVGDRITNKELFIVVTASKKRVFEQEAVLLTYKLYTLVNINGGPMGNIPKLDGFHVQELNRQHQLQLKMEHYNGRNYGTIVFSQYVVFPQQTGTLTIPEIKYEVPVLQQTRSADPFDIFFGGGTMTQEVRKTVMAPAVTLQVDALPTPRPANFSGAVGHFNIASTLTPQQLKANDATTLRLTVAGTGNMKLMKAPDVQWPKDFERYDPKVEDKTAIGANGSSGSVLYDFIAVPRHQGKFELPSVEFCYFDPDAREYKTVQTSAYSIEVEKGKGGSSASPSLSKEEVELLNSDIHYIKQGAPTYLTADSAFFGSNRYWFTYLAVFLIFGILMFAFRRRAVANADLIARRGKGASKAATKRLKTARKLMAENNATAFYEETMKALWGYVGDKLNIPVSELSKDNVREKLTVRQLSNELIDQFLHTLDDCEFARFAPGDPADTMDKIYASAEEVINKMESELKRK